MLPYLFFVDVFFCFPLLRRFSWFVFVFAKVSCLSSSLLFNMFLLFVILIHFYTFRVLSLVFIC